MNELCPIHKRKLYTLDTGIKICLLCKGVKEITNPVTRRKYPVRPLPEDTSIRGLWNR